MTHIIRERRSPEPVLRVLKPRDAVKLFRSLETGCAKNISRHNQLFLRELISSKDFHFKKVFSYSQRSKIQVKSDKIFIKSGREAYNVYGGGIAPKFKVYSIQRHLKGTRLSDGKTLFFKSSLEKSVLTPRDMYRPFLFILTDDNHLLHIDFDTGQLLDKIYLGSLQRCKFAYIGWETFAETVSITSTETKNPENSQTVQSYMILMKIHPLRFVACFKVDSAKFGGQKSANLTDGMLILCKTISSVNKLITITDLSQVLAANTLWVTDLDERCSHQCDECAYGETIVGRGKHGFPQNVVITQIPEPVLSMATSTESIEYGSYPFHVIYCPPGDRTTFLVKKVGDEERLNGGLVKFINFMDGYHRVVFHEDELDKRVITVHSHKLTFNRIVDQCMFKRFEISCTPKAFLRDWHKRTRNRLKRERRNDTASRSIFAFTHDPETEIYCIFGVDLSDKQPDRPVVCLFDNYTGNLLSKMFLSFQVDETNEYEIYLDNDLIVINEQDLANNGRIFVYRLARKPFIP